MDRWLIAVSLGARMFVLVTLALGAREATATPGRVTLRGVIVDADTLEPTAGATVVASGDRTKEEVGITDETGHFQLDAQAPVSTLTIYIDDTTIERKLFLNPAVEDVDLGKITILVKHVPCCVDEFPGAPMIDLDHAFQVTFDRRWPTLRSRDTSSLLPVIASARATLTTSFDGGRRLAGAPGISLALIDEMTVYPMRAATSLEEASDGITIDPRHGTSESKGDARLAYSNDGTHVEAAAGGPILRDHLWWFAGGDVSSSGHQELARVDVAPTSNDHGHVLAMHQQLSPPELRVADDFADAQWESKFDDGKYQLTAGLTGERLDDDSATDAITTRGSAYLRLHKRGKLLGYHHIVAGAEVGGGRLGDAAHEDTSGHLGDAYQLQPNITVDAGVRWDERWFAGSHATVWQPHLTLGYDWTNEARADVFVAVARASLLDANGIGGWRMLPHARNDVAVGLRYEVIEGWLVSVAGRGSELGDARKEGIDVQIDHRGRYLQVYVTGTSVEKAIAGFAGVVLDHRWRGDDSSESGTNGVVAGITGRYAFDDADLWGSQIGGRLAWSHQVVKQLSTTLGGELLHDRTGTLGAAVLTFAY